MSISYLPDDQIVVILVRLPPKTLGRFKSVSKSWNVSISSPEFAKMHVINQPRVNQNPNIIVKKIDCDGQLRTKSEQIHMVEFSIDRKNLELGCEIQRLHHPFESLHIDQRTARIVGFCNGLLCQIFGRDEYWECENGITLCNPLTKSSWNLPKRPGLVKDQNRKKMNRRRISFYGFGYDDIHNDYKVMIASFRPYYINTGSMIIHEYEYEFEFEVYSLRSDTWSRIRSYLDSRDYSICCPYSFSDGLLVNCALHWILRNNQKNSILAFDLKTDKHKIFAIPEFLEKNNYLRLSVLNSCLVLSFDWDYYFGAVATSSYDLWVMKDYGLKDSMIRIPLYNLRSNSLHTPVAFFRDNNCKRKLILYDLRRGLMLLYDCVSHHVQQFPASCGFHYAKQFEFVGSLVQPHPPSKGDAEINGEAKKSSFFRII